MISRHALGDAYPIRKLGDIVDFLDNLRKPVKESERVAGPYPYFGANGIQGFISDYIFDEPLVLLAEDGGHFENPDRGVAYRIEGKTWVNNHAHVLRPRPSVDLAYLCRVLENYDVTPWVTGTTRGKLTKAGASEIEIPMPPLPEQRRIAAILDKADALRAKRREAIAKLDQLLQSVFLEMFGDPVTNSKGWPETDFLGDVADICSGITKGRRTTEETRDIPYLAVANVQDRHLKLGSVKTICATDAEIERYRLAVNDLLLTEGGDPDKLGRGALWDGSIRECIHQNHVFRVRITSPVINPVFLNWLVGSARGKRYFLSVSKQTTGIASINMTQLKKFPLLAPPIALQTQFALAVSKIEVHKRELEKARDSAEQLFQALQQQAFTGTL